MLMRRPLSIVVTLLGAMLSLASSPSAAKDLVPLAPNASAELGAGEGHLAIVFDSLNRIQSARFVERDGLATKFSFKEVPEGIHLFVVRVPAGNYCLDSFRAGKVRYEHKTDKDPFCITVRAGGLTYPGHYAPRAGYGRYSITQIEQKPVEFLRRMALEQPTILAAHEELDDGRDLVESRRGEVMRWYSRAAFSLPDTALGERYLQRAVALGSVDALLDLGYRTVEGDGIRPDRRKAIEYYERAAAAGSAIGARSACYELLQLPREDANEKRARTLCERAVELGDGAAHYWLAMMRRGSLGGLTPDPTVEFELFSAGGAKGHPWSQYEAALALRDGKGTPREPVAAKALLEKAVEGKVPEAMLALGRMLSDDQSIEPARIADLYQKAYDARIAGSGAALADLHNRGRGVTRDPARARDILRAASQWSYDDASAYAWFLSTSPDGSLRDGAEALNWAESIVLQRRPRQTEDLVVLAAAYAENNNFDAATRNINRAIAETARRAKPDDPKQKAWAAQRDSYAKKKPWRETVP